MTPELKTQFKNDVFSLLRHEKGGHVERWLYSDHLYEPDSVTGANLMESFNNTAQSYYIVPNSQKLIPQLTSQLSGLMAEFDTVADFGCGGKRAVMMKALPIVQGCPNVKIYAPLDFSQENLNSAQTVIERNAPQLSVKPQKVDFFANSVHLPGQKVLGLFLGSTISNLEMREGSPLPIHRAIDALSKIRASLSNANDNMLIVDYDSNHDMRSLFAAYDNVYGNRFVSALMYQVHDFLKPEGHFYPSQWYCERVFDPNNHVLHHCIACSMDQDFEIDGMRFQIKRGQRFVAINSIKYPTDIFHDIALQAGFRPLAPVQDDEERITFQPLMV